VPTTASQAVETCLSKAQALGEPYFVLRAQDDSSSGLVREWAETFRANHIRLGTSGHALAAAITKYTQALEVADAMDAWATRKQAD
jgi:hypothetical protein